MNPEHELIRMLANTLRDCPREHVTQNTWWHTYALPALEAYAEFVKVQAKETIKFQDAKGRTYVLGASDTLAQRSLIADNPVIADSAPEPCKPGCGRVHHTDDCPRSKLAQPAPRYDEAFYQFVAALDADDSPKCTGIGSTCQVAFCSDACHAAYERGKAEGAAERQAAILRHIHWSPNGKGNCVCPLCGFEAEWDSEKRAHYESCHGEHIAKAEVK